jgi:hypothetical protein
MDAAEDRDRSDSSHLTCERDDPVERGRNKRTGGHGDIDAPMTPIRLDGRKRFDDRSRKGDEASGDEGQHVRYSFVHRPDGPYGVRTFPGTPPPFPLRGVTASIHD